MSSILTTPFFAISSIILLICSFYEKFHNLFLDCCKYSLHRYNQLIHTCFVSTKARKHILDLQKISYDIYIYQLQTWDCGLACCAMLTTYDNEIRNNYSNMDHMNGFHLMQKYHRQFHDKSSPLWTIELYHLLIKDIPREFLHLYSTAKSIEDHHYDITWYQSQIHDDGILINNLYSDLKTSLYFHHECFETCKLLHLFSQEKHSMAIILVNNIDMDIIIPEIFRKSSSSLNKAFVGHFILVIGYISETDNFVYLNPSLGFPELKYISSSKLDMARSHQGTDYDIIIYSTNPGMLTSKYL